MEQTTLCWEVLSFEGWQGYLTIFAIVLIAAATDFNEVKRRNKIILAVVGILMLMTLPLARRLNVIHLVEKHGYVFVVQEGMHGINESYHEADPDDHLWQVFRRNTVFYREQEHKLIFFHERVMDVYPGSLDEIQFYEGEGEP